jgi:hypothetical protein
MHTAKDSFTVLHNSRRKIEAATATVKEQASQIGKSDDANGRLLRRKYEGKIMRAEVKTKLDCACRGLSLFR